MKKLAIIGTIAVAVAVPLVTAGVAAAKPTGMSPAEYRALILDAQGSIQGTGIGSATLERGRGERFAVDNPIRSVEPVNPKHGIGSLTLERSAGERFAPDNPVNGQTPSAGGSDFQWGDAGVGAGVLLGLLALLGAGVVGLRHRGQVSTS